MATITVRNLDDGVRDKLRIRAAEHGRSMEAEARAILEAATANPYAGMNVGQAFRDLGKQFGGVTLEQPDRGEFTRNPFDPSEGWS